MHGQNFGCGLCGRGEGEGAESNKKLMSISNCKLNIYNVHKFTYWTLALDYSAKISIITKDIIVWYYIHSKTYVVWTHTPFSLTN